jgi:hypothetical protein
MINEKSSIVHEKSSIAHEFHPSPLSPPHACFRHSIAKNITGRGESLLPIPGATNIDPLRGKVIITFQQFPTTSDQ